MQITDHFLAFLKAFFAIFPEHAQDDLYLAGESYAGTYIPYFAKGVIDHNDDVPQGEISYNLKGLAIGNGWIDPLTQYTSYIPYLDHHGLSTPDLQDKLIAQQDRCLDAIRLQNSITQNACEILVKIILDESTKGPENTQCLNQYDVRLKDAYPECGLLWPYELPQMKTYLSRKDVREALHATGISGEWSECNSAVGQALRFDNAQPSFTLLPGVLEKVNVMLYSGDQDLICNHIGTEYLISNMTWQGAQGFQEAPKIPWTVDEKPAGIWRQERNLTYVLLYNASHMVPYDTPLAAMDMINRFMGLDPTLQPFTSKFETVDSGNQEELPPGGEKVDIDQPRRSSGTRALILLIVLVAICAAIFVIARNNRRKKKFSGDDEVQWFPLNNSGSSDRRHGPIHSDELDELVVEGGIRSDDDDDDEEEYHDGAFDSPDPDLDSPLEQRR
ncbi:Cell death protease [Mortierella sp. AM989]|nr:Cell death protease [Mortierella sp. AM989]